MKLNKNELNEEFLKFSKEWVDTEEYNAFIYDYFTHRVSINHLLNNHTNVVGQYNLGYGEPAFRYLWAVVFSQIPNNGKFLEIGVFKGSILALSQLICKELGITINTYGVTPLNNTGDKYSSYGFSDYEKDISFLYSLLEIPIDNSFIIEGLSTNSDIKNLILDNGPYDILYIDGGHDYETVISDIELSTKILKKDGILVMDDASSMLNLPKNHRGFNGHAEVALAIRDKIDSDSTYTHLFACGHNRVWRKNK